MKTTKHYGTVISIEGTNMYGRYLITATYKNVPVRAYTADSVAYDWIDDESNPVKHAWAKRHCLSKIKEAYNNRIKRRTI
jgi:hypothetical protein